VRSATPAALVGYEAVVAVWIYAGFRHGSGGTRGLVIWAVAAVAGIALGAYGRSWWLLLAPVAAPLFAIPAGDYPNGELPVWLAVLPAVPALAFWIAVGVGAARLRARRS
jgi:hypothetical protein